MVLMFVMVNVRERKYVTQLKLNPSLEKYLFF